MTNHRSTGLMQQLGLALLGQALPKPPVLSAMIDDFRKGLVAAIVCGVLASAVLLLSCYGFFRYLVAEGLAAGSALVISGALITLLSFFLGLLARNHFSRLTDQTNQLGFFPEKQESSPSLDQIVAAFLHGLMNTSPLASPEKEINKEHSRDDDKNEKEPPRERIILVKE